MKYSRIIGTGSYLPSRIMTNAEIEKMVDTSDEWIQTRTGIKQRHIAEKDETTSDMALHAANNALSSCQVKAEDIDLIIVATSTPDLIYPSTACLLQKKLGIKNGSPAFDVQAVCSGFVYATTVADKFIKSGAANRALVVGADMNSKILNWEDRSTCVLFGDGAGAIVMEASDEPGIYATRLHANGEYAEMLRVPSGVSSPGGSPYIEMSGSEVFKFAVNVMGDIVDEILEAANMDKHDIDWLVPHQANKRIITATAKKLNLSIDKVMLTVSDHGNTSAASIPLALDRGVRNGDISKGEVLLFEAVGGGFTWGAVLLKY